MAIVECKSTLTHDRIKRKHTKDSMASVMYKTYHTLMKIREDKTIDHSAIKDILDRIAWG